MSKFDEYYNVRLAKVDDVDNIMNFIRKEWNENHILGNNKELFLWQHGRHEYGDKENINYVLMTDKEDNIVGTIGYIAYSNDKENMHISTTMTKIFANNKIPMAGIQLMKWQIKLVGEKINFASGTNPKTILPLFQKVFHHEVGYMQQFYMLNPKKQDYKVAKVKEPIFLAYAQTNYKMEEVEEFSEVENQFDLDIENQRMVKKSKEFINKRYFEHPVYKYLKWFIKDADEKIVGLLIAREIEVNFTHILRIVDYRGELKHLSCIGEALHTLMWQRDYEYIDLMVSSLSGEEMRRAGFLLLDPDGEVIIPNYFEPFLQKNIKNFCQKNADIVIFKADGDQDRPNVTR